MIPSGLVVVGRILRARGRHGELIAEIDSAQPGRAERLHHVKLVLPGRERESIVERLWHHDGRPIFKFAGIDSISDAEPWHGAAICIPAEERVQADEGEYFFADLVGCRVDTADGPLGVVREIEDYGGALLLRVETADGRDVLVPFARSICREIDVAAKRIRAELPEGLTEL